MNKKSLNINILFTVAKTVVSLLFPLITFPYVTRVLSPSGIGEYNYSNSIITYFVLIAGLGINTYAIREGAKIRDSKEKFNEFANEILSLNFFSTIAAYLLLFACFALFPEFQSHKPSLLIISALIVFKTIGVEWVFCIYEDYIYITLRSLVFQVISVLCLFIFVKTPNDVLPYIAINVLSNVGSNFLNFLYSRKYFNIKPRFSWKMWHHIVPVLVIFSTTLSTMIYVNSDTTMLGWMCGTEQVGYYAVAGKMYNIIKSALNAIVPVFMTRLSFQYDNDRAGYQETFRYAFNLLTTVTIPLAVGALFYSDTVILLLSGEEYLQATTGMKLLFVSLIFASLGNLYSSGGILQARKEKWMLFATGGGACLNILANLYFIPLIGCTGAALTTLITEMTVFVILFICFREYIGCRVGMRHIMNCFLGTVPFFAIYEIGMKIMPGSTAVRLIQIVVSGLLYLAMLFIFKDEIVVLAVKKITKKRC